MSHPKENAMVALFVAAVIVVFGLAAPLHSTARHIEALLVLALLGITAWLVGRT
jgi:hypothetical protein